MSCCVAGQGHGKEMRIQASEEHPMSALCVGAPGTRKKTPQTNLRTPVAKGNQIHTH